MSPRFRIRLVAFTLAFAPGDFGLAQTASQTVRSASTPDESVVMLDPFTTTARESEGYRAQSSVSGLPFVVALEKAPLSINILTQEFLLDTASFRVEDALRFTSGVANGERNEGGTERYVIRGFRTNSLFINGAAMNTPTDTSVIERVEVLKGPSTILYGALDPGGLVNIATKRASYQDTTQFTATVAEYGTDRGSLDVNRKLGRLGHGIQFAGRIVGTGVTEGSYLPNEFRDRWIVAPSLRVDLSPTSHLDLGVIRTHERGRINRLQTPWASVNSAELAAASSGFVPVIRDFTFVTPDDQWHYDSTFYDLQWSHRLLDNLHLFVSYSASDADADQYFLLGTGNIVPTAAGLFNASGRMTTQLTHRENEVYTFKAVYDLKFFGVAHKLALVARRNNPGSYSYGFYDNRLPVTTPLTIADANGARFVRFIGQPRVLTDPYSPFATASQGNVNSTVFDPAMNWNATITDYITLFNGRLNILAGGQYSTIRAQERQKAVPQIGAVYELWKGLNAYALYSATFSPNGRSDSTDPNSPYLPPENGKGFEGGLKLNLFDRRIFGSLAAFQIVRDNVSQTLAGTGINGNIIVPSGEETVNGFEADILFHATSSWAVNLSYAYMDGYISHQEINADNPDNNGDGVSDAVGLPKEGVAKNDVRIWTRYSFAPASPLEGLAFGGGYTWRQGPIQQFGTYLQRFIRQEDSPQRIDLFTSYRMRLLLRQVDLRLNWQNATDEVYRDRRGKFVDPSTLVFSLSTKL